jgi:hypothetical protein
VRLSRVVEMAFDYVIGARSRPGNASALDGIPAVPIPIGVSEVDIRNDNHALAVPPKTSAAAARIRNAAHV